MALDANVVCLNIIQACRIYDISSRWVADVLTSGTMAFIAANVPLSDGFRLNVVIDGMAAVAKRTRRPPRIGLRIELGPPIASRRGVVRAPDLVRDILLRDFLEIPLLPFGPVQERDVVPLERKQGSAFARSGTG